MLPVTPPRPLAMLAHRVVERRDTARENARNAVSSLDEIIEPKPHGGVATAWHNRTAIWLQSCLPQRRPTFWEVGRGAAWTVKAAGCVGVGATGGMLAGIADYTCYWLTAAVACELPPAFDVQPAGLAGSAFGALAGILFACGNEEHAAVAAAAVGGSVPGAGFGIIVGWGLGALLTGPVAGWLLVFHKSTTGIGTVFGASARVIQGLAAVTGALAAAALTHEAMQPVREVEDSVA